MKNMRGFIDPITLGFVIALLGSTTAYVAHKDKGTSLVASTQIETTKVQIVK